MYQFRVGLFIGSASMAGAFSGLLAYAISFMSGTDGLLGWSWIFVCFPLAQLGREYNGLLVQIIEGTATVAVGIIASFVMVDFPNTATFLTPEERAYVIWKKSAYWPHTANDLFTM